MQPLRPDPYAAAYAAAAAVNVLDAQAPVLTVDERLSALYQALFGSLTPDAAGLPQTLAGVLSLLRVMLGQQSVPSGQWRMSAYQSATRLDALTDTVAALQQLVQELASGASATSSKVVALMARVQLIEAAGNATQAQLVADQLRLSALEAKDVLLASATEANRLDIVALKAEDVALKARATQDEAAIAAAQATATQARTEAAAAQKKADDDATAVLAAQATASAAQQQAASNATALAAVQADVATRLPAAMVQRFTIATPAVTIQVGTPATFSVPLPKAFADNQYLVFFTKATGTALLNVQLGDTAKLPASFTATMQQTGPASLLVPASTAEVLVFHL